MIHAKKRLSKKEKEAKTEKFIKSAGRAKKTAHGTDGANSKLSATPVMIKIPQPRLDAIDALAEQLRLTRSAFMMTLVLEGVERLEIAGPAERTQFVQQAISSWVMR